MTTERQFWIWVLVLAVGMFVLVGVQAALFYLNSGSDLSRLSDPMRMRLLLFLAVTLLTLLPFLVWGMRSWYSHYVVPVHRIIEDVEALLYGSHLARLPLDANDPVGLAPLLNALMERYQESEDAVQGRLESALGALGEEKSRLESLLEGLSEGVVEFSVEGQVVRYNQAARTLFARQAIMSVGMSVEELINPAMVVFAREALQDQLAKEVPHPFTSFTCRNAGDGLLRARIAPLLVFGGRLAGYVLTVEPEKAADMATQESEGLARETADPDASHGGTPSSEITASQPHASRTDAPTVRGDRLLSDLRFVVLDTETTGLEPGEGDEVISLGAVVVYHGHVMPGEDFDRLVDPGRPINPSAQRVHGIRDEDLFACPPMGDVLPEFIRFARDAVWVAHNAAFDMTFLRRDAQRFGLRLENPVLDTMLLSAALHPHQPSQSLDALLTRYGLPVKDRHSALGDARMTAELLLRLLPQLEARGITTLESALAVSRRTPLARLSYG